MTNIKYFGLNFVDGNTAFTFTSALTANAIDVYDNDRNTKLISVGSNDATPEVWEFDFGSSKTFDRIFIDNHNIKTGKIEYWTGAVWADFSTPISWVANTDVTNYYEFNQVSSQKVRLTMNTTMIANAEKFVGEFRVLLELGELNTNPSEFVPKFGIRQAKHKTSEGGIVLVKFGKKFILNMLLSDAEDTDVTLIESLYDRNDAFYIFPCGGVTTYTERGIRIEDMYLVNILDNFEPNLKRNQLTGIGTRMPLKFHEV